MEEKRNNLINAIRLWLDKNDLASDTTIYSIEDWRMREEPYHNDSDFVISTEGELYHLLNFGSVNQQIEFEDLICSFGFLYEFGHSWNLGFYYDQTEKPKITKLLSYSEKLKDPKWLDKRELVKDNAEYKCQDCGSLKSLEVHHCYYQFGREPWEYPLDAMRCLCRSCHERRGKLETVLRAKFADLNYDELDVFQNLISTSILSFNRNAFFTFLYSMGRDYDLMDMNYEDLKTKKRFENNM